MFSFLRKDVQLKIYYLYMMADGQCTEDENDKFMSICESMDTEETATKEIISFCQEVVHSTGSDNSSKVIHEITKLLDDQGSGFFLFGSINRDKKTQAKVIWTLINLGYSDDRYSEPEQKVISFLVDYWKMDNTVLSDMTDTAETILALTKQKEWIKTTNKPYDIISKFINEIDESINQLFQNIEILISEAEII
jgi:uncharacterized tellurite resistance protein B-like protein